MIAHRTAAQAAIAWDAGNRRRRARAGLERAVDALMASGGMLIVNSAGSFDLGLPDGVAGWSLGGSLLAAGLAWMAHNRRGTSRSASQTFAPAHPARQIRREAA